MYKIFLKTINRFVVFVMLHMNDIWVFNFLSHDSALGIPTHINHKS